MYLSYISRYTRELEFTWVEYAWRMFKVTMSNHDILLHYIYNIILYYIYTTWRHLLWCDVIFQ